MWAEMSAPEDGAEGAEVKQPMGVVRACVLNLVVYAEGAEARAEVDDLLGAVIERHPCRAIVLAAERGAAVPMLEAFVSTRCQLSARGRKRICGEQITIEAAGTAVETAATAVAPLLVPDVPVFLWWKDIPHYEDRLFYASRGDGRPRRHRLRLVRRAARRPSAPGTSARRRPAPPERPQLGAPDLVALARRGLLGRGRLSRVALTHREGLHRVRPARPRARTRSPRRRCSRSVGSPRVSAGRRRKALRRSRTAARVSRSAATAAARSRPCSRRPAARPGATAGSPR